MPEEFLLRAADNEKAIRKLREAGYRYAGTGGCEAGRAESTKYGWIYPPPSDPMDATSRREAIKYNIAALDNGSIILVNGDKEGSQDHHRRLREFLHSNRLLRR